jgi:uncharacterized beta-barrel protein YwiB (DUF1934 family)
MELLDMPDKKEVLIEITSTQGKDKSVQKIKGEVIVAKDGAFYVKYEEPDRGPTGGITRTMVKISSGEIKIMRHGEVESQQAFTTGQRLPGFYRSPFTKFNLSTDTQKVETHLEGANGTVFWEYDLYVYDELSGHFAISLNIQEEV